MKAYSYIRWSSDQQTVGDSYTRQIELTRKICKERGWDLDESLEPAQGVSAYRGKNLENGSLATFIREVKAGTIKTPCVLVVEALDRITRTRLRDARAFFEGLLALKVMICTANNGKTYDETSLDNPMDLFMSLMELNASYQYAAMLGKRVSAAWTRKKEAAKNGALLTKRTPAWIKAEINQGKKVMIIDEKKADIIRRIFKEYLQGKGTRLISLGLNKENIPTFGWGKSWSPTPIKRYLTSPSVIGNYQPHKYTEKNKRHAEGEEIINYYPAIIDKYTFYSVQQKIKERSTTKGARKHLFNLFSGLLKCANCGATMVLKTGAVTNIGTKQPWVTLVCSQAVRAKGCIYKTIKYEQIEKAVLSFLCPKLRSGIQSQETKEPGKFEVMVGEHNETKAKIEKLNKLIQGESSIPKIVLKTLSELESKEEELRARIELYSTKEEEGLTFWEWKPITKNIENRILLQGILRSLIHELIIDAVKQEVSFLPKINFKHTIDNSPVKYSTFKITWGEDYKTNYLINGRKEKYIDDMMIWENQESKDFWGKIETEVIEAKRNGTFNKDS